MSVCAALVPTMAPKTATVDKKRNMRIRIGPPQSRTPTRRTCSAAARSGCTWHTSPRVSSSRRDDEQDSARVHPDREVRQNALGYVLSVGVVASVGGDEAAIGPLRLPPPGRVRVGDIERRMRRFVEHDLFREPDQRRRIGGRDQVRRHERPGRRRPEQAPARSTSSTYTPSTSTIIPGSQSNTIQRTG